MKINEENLKIIEDGVPMGFTDTSTVELPSDPLARVIGHEKYRDLILIAALQRRNLFLVGVPGIGKSMIAKALSHHLPPVTQEVYSERNENNSERPRLRVVTYSPDEVDQINRGGYEVLFPSEVPPSITYPLNFLCKFCDTISSSDLVNCPKCGRRKYTTESRRNPTQGIMDIFNRMGVNVAGNDSQQEGDNITAPLFIEVPGSSNRLGGLYERHGTKIHRYDGSGAVARRTKLDNTLHPIVQLGRKKFVQLSGASETELLGDVLHDPFGGEKSLGTEAYKRIVPGAIHEAHQGVLYIDEISSILEFQKKLLTAMEDKVFPITGRMSRSTGGTVKLEGVPCDFVLVAAANLQDLKNVSSALRSRIRGGGYEITMESHVPLTVESVGKYIQMIAQEVEKAGNIPHFTRDAAIEIIKFGVGVAMKDGFKNSLTLRIREIVGVVKAAGDYAVLERSDLVTIDHVLSGLKYCKSAEEQAIDIYGSLSEALNRDYMVDRQGTDDYKNHEF